MRNFILLLFVSSLFTVNAQVSISNPVSNVLVLECYNYIDNPITVPQGKFWQVIYSPNATNNWRFLPPIGSEFSWTAPMSTSVVLPEGYRLYFSVDTCQSDKYLNILEYNYNTDEGLGFNYVEPLKDRIKLFPNPTTNELALNSDKVYQIEVFDLAGNKVMEFKGNSINVEHLSSATYIVNAIDLETTESLSYKVIKK